MQAIKIENEKTSYAPRISIPKNIKYFASRSVRWIRKNISESICIRVTFKDNNYHILYIAASNFENLRVNKL